MLRTHFSELAGMEPPLLPVLTVNALRLQFNPGVLPRLFRAALRGQVVRVGTVKPGETESKRLRLLDLLEWANGQKGPIDIELCSAGDVGVGRKF